MLNINVKDYRPLAERAVRAYTRNVFSGFFSEDGLNDLVSEVVTRMWVKRDKYDESLGTVSAWVGKIAKNMVLDAVKSEKRRRSLFSSTPLVERVDEDGDAVGFVPIAADQTDSMVIVHDTERALRESVSDGRETRLLNGLIQGCAATELSEAENVGAPVIHTAVCRLRKRLRSTV